MFIKRGDGKILSVIDENELDEKSKKAVKEVSEKIVESQTKENTQKSGK